MIENRTRVPEAGADVSPKLLVEVEEPTLQAFVAMRAARAGSTVDVMTVRPDFIREQSSRSMSQVRETGDLIVGFGHEAMASLIGNKSNKTMEAQLTPSPAPRPAAAGIGAGEAFGDQHGAGVAAVGEADVAELAAIDILVAVDRRQGEGLGEQFLQPLGRPGAESGFPRAARRVGFGRVDAGDADAVATIVERVAIDHAGGRPQADPGERRHMRRAARQLGQHQPGERAGEQHEAEFARAHPDPRARPAGHSAAGSSAGLATGWSEAQARHVRENRSRG
jgi:hypothetical protein